MLLHDFFLGMTLTALLFAITKRSGGIANPIPKTFARVVDARIESNILGPLNKLDVFVTDADATRNLNARK